MTSALCGLLVAVFLLSSAGTDELIIVTKNCCILFKLLDAQNCSTTGAVRLVWGAGPWEGNLQICLNDIWGWVCHNSFSNVDAMVACRQLGYSTGGL